MSVIEFSPAAADSDRLYHISASLKKLKRLRRITLAAERFISVEKNIVEPNIRSKAATMRRYSFPPFTIPNASSISAADRKRITWLFCRTVRVARKIKTNEEHKAKVAKSAEALRTDLVGDEIHSRTPEIVTKLQASFNLFLDFAVHSGAIEEAERKKLEDRCWIALRTVAAAQTKHQVSAEPTERYLTLLRSLLASGKAHLSPRKLEDPDSNFEAIGWRTSANGWLPNGACLGWVDSEGIYLEPAASFRAIQNETKDSADFLSLNEQTMRKRLNEKGLLASVDKTRQTLTVRKAIQGHSKQVLHLLYETVFPSDPESEAENVGCNVGSRS